MELIEYYAISDLIDQSERCLLDTHKSLSATQWYIGKYKIEFIPSVIIDSLIVECDNSRFSMHFKKGDVYEVISDRVRE